MKFFGFHDSLSSLDNLRADQCCFSNIRIDFAVKVHDKDSQIFYIGWDVVVDSFKTGENQYYSNEKD